MLIPPEIQRHAGKYYGKYSGEVTDNADPDLRGRVKVKVPAIFGPDLEVWARPCFPYGHFFVPPVGGKVWVEFEAGDPGYPLWVGTWYPVGETPDVAQIDPPDNRVIQTVSGHTIELMDQEGEEKIVIKHKDNSFFSIDKDGNVLIANKEGSHLHLSAKDGNATLMEQHGNLVTMGENGIVITNADGTTIEMKGGAVKVVAADAMQVSAKDVILDSSSVSLGNGAGESVLLGDAFKQMWDQFIFHTHATGVGPSGPPLPPALPLAPGVHLSLGVKTA